MGKFLTLEERLANGRGGVALFRGEEGVAAGKRQAGGLTYDGARHQLEVKAQMSHHGADDGDLLEVLFAEIGAVGIAHLEEPADNLADPIEMAGAACAFHDAVGGGVGEYPGVRCGINLLYGRCKDDDRALGGNGGFHGGFCAGDELAVGIERPGIVGKVGFVVELRGIDKDTDDSDVVLADASADERLVAGVEGAHGGDKSYGLVVVPGMIDSIPECCYGVNDFHNG